MSWKDSRHYWSCGFASWHVFMHALDPKQRSFYELTIGSRTWQVWPPPSVLNHQTEWTVQTPEELHRLARWVLARLHGDQP